MKSCILTVSLLIMPYYSNIKCCKRGKMMKSTLLLVILLTVLAEGSYKNKFSHIRSLASISPGGRTKSVPILQQEGYLELECSECIAFMNKVFDAKRNSKEMQESDLKTARSVICPENPDFPICQRNEVSVWENAFLTPELASTFCTSLPINDCNKDK